MKNEENKVNQTEITDKNLELVTGGEAIVPKILEGMATQSIEPDTERINVEVNDHMSLWQMQRALRNRNALSALNIVCYDFQYNGSNTSCTAFSYSLCLYFDYMHKFRCFF